MKTIQTKRMEEFLLAVAGARKILRAGAPESSGSTAGHLRLRFSANHHRHAEIRLAAEELAAYLDDKWEQILPEILQQGEARLSCLKELATKEATENIAQIAQAGINDEDET